MEPGDPAERLRRSGVELSERIDELSGAVLALDTSGNDCVDLAARYGEFAGRWADEYPSLAEPAARLAELFADLQRVLGRLSGQAESVISRGGALADGVLDLSDRPPGQSPSA